MNIVTNMLIIPPKRNIAPASAPNMNPENPNAVNIP